MKTIKTFKNAVVVGLLLLLFSSLKVKAQNVAITDEDSHTPDVNAMLDVFSYNKGLLIPRVDLVDQDNPISGTKEQGLLVWNNYTGGNYAEVGFYFWNGSDWEMVGSNTNYENGLYQSGNYVGLGGSLNQNTTIINGGYNFKFNLTGTGAFEVQDNGTSALLVDENGNVGIGNNAPSESLDLGGNLKLGNNIMLKQTATNLKTYENLASYAYNGSIAGAFVINTNQPKNSNCMFRLRVSGYVHNSNGPIDILISGYTYSTAYNNLGHVNITSQKLNVRVAQNASGNLAIILGDEGTTYSYPNVVVEEYVQAYSGTIVDYAKGWTVERSTDLSGDGFTYISTVPDYTDLDLTDYYTTTYIDEMEAGLQSAISDEDLWDRSGSYTLLKNSDNVGFGTSTPLGKLHVVGSAALGSVIIAPSETSSGDDAEIVLAEDHDNTYSMSWKYDGGYNKMFAYGKSGGTTYGPFMSMNRTDGRIGIGTGTSNPSSTLVVQGNTTGAIDDPLFEVKNNTGQTVFAVYNEGVRIYVNDDPTGKAVGNRGGFAVGGISSSKGETNEFLRVTPDSVRVYIDTDETKAVGNRGGFAVGGISSSKGTITDLMRLRKNNYFIGHESGVVNSGTYNTFLGYQSGRANTTGQKNLFLGHQAGITNTTGSTNIFIGNNAGYFNTTGAFNVFIGNESGAFNQEGEYNTSVGFQAGMFSGFTGGAVASYNTFLGYQAGYQNYSGVKNTAIGYQAGYDIDDGHHNVFIGDLAGRETEDGYYNTFVGSESGHDNTNGFYNTFIGYRAGHENTTAGYNTIMGYDAGYSNTTAQGQAFFGYRAGHTTTGGGNTYIGNEAGYYSYGGTDNTYIGGGAGRGGTGSSNVFIGKYAGYSETGSNLLYIENSTSSSPLIWGDFANNKVKINGTLGIGTTPSTSYGLIVNGGTSSSYSIYAYKGGYTPGTWYSASDKRYKKDITPIANALNIIRSINGVTYTWKRDEFTEMKFDDKVHLGVIAQEVEKVLPYVVNTNEDGFKAVTYERFTPVLIEAIKEQQKQIEALKKELQLKDEEISTLKSKTDQIQDLQEQLNKINEILNLKVENR